MKNMIKIWKLFQDNLDSNRDYLTSIVSASITLSLSTILYFYLFRNIELHSFNDRVIGIATLESVNTGARSIIYFANIAICIFFFFMIRTLFNYIFELEFIKSIIVREEKYLVKLSEIYIFILIVLLITREKYLIYALGILAFVILNLLSSWIIEYLTKKFEVRNINKVISNPQTKSAIFIYSISLTFLILLLLDSSVYFYLKYFVLVLGLNIVQLVFITFIPEKIIEKLIINVFPIALIPTLAIVANEINYTFAFHNYNPKMILILLTLFLLPTSIFTYFYFSKKKFDVFNFLLTPFFVGSGFLVRFYSDKMFIDKLDIFHYGETNLPAHQLFEHSKIPLIDILSTHSLSSLITQIFYYLINGFSPLNGYISFLIVGVASFISIYFMILYVTKRDALASTLILFFLPINAFFPLFYAAVIPVVFGIYLALKKNNKLYNFILILGVFNLILLLWRIDFGIASIIATFTIFIHIFYTSKIRNKNNTLKIFLLLFISVLILSILLVIIVNSNQKSTLIQFIKFIAIQNESASYPTIVNDIKDLRAPFQYMLLPFTATIYLISYIYSFIKRKQLSTQQYIIIFLSIFSLIISVRTVQRHSLVEGAFFGFLFYFLLTLIPLYYLNLKSKLIHFWYLTLIVCISLFILPFTNTSYGVPVLIPYNSQPSNTTLIKSGKVFEFTDWTYNEDRVVVKDKSNFLPIVEFLNDNLNEDEIFYDFTNAPMIYIYTNKEFPTYIIPNLYQTTDTIQNEVINDLESYRKDNRLKFVIFKQNNYWDSLDDVPNEIRSYRIAEYIYKNYKPYKNVNNFEVWIDNSNTEESNLTIASQQFNLRMLPYIWANFDEKNSIESTQVLIEGNLLDNKIDIPETLDKTSGNYLSLKVNSKVDSKIKVYFNDDKDNFITFDVRSSDLSLNYLVRISTLHSWFEDVKTVNIETNDSNIETFSIRKGD